MTWTAANNDGPDEWVTHLLGTEWGDRVRYSESHHDDERGTVNGTVRAIHEVRCRRELQVQQYGNVLVPIPGSGWLTEVAVADPWTSTPADERRDSMSFDGWIVELETP